MPVVLVVLMVLVVQLVLLMLVLLLHGLADFTGPGISQRSRP